jgi:hypothetical protein
MLSLKASQSAANVSTMDAQPVRPHRSPDVAERAHAELRNPLDKRGPAQEKSEVSA